MMAQAPGEEGCMPTEKRESITLLGGAAVWPLAARAQQEKACAAVGVLIAIADDAEGQARLGAFKSGMRDLGGSTTVTLGWKSVRRRSVAMRTTMQWSYRPCTDVLVANSSPAVAALQQWTRTSDRWSPRLWIRSALASWRTWSCPATLPASSALTTLSARSGWTCSRRSPRASRASACCVIRRRPQ